MNSVTDCSGNNYVISHSEEVMKMKIMEMWRLQIGDYLNIYPNVTICLIHVRNNDFLA